MIEGCPMINEPKGEIIVGLFSCGACRLDGPFTPSPRTVENRAPQQLILVSLNR
jgi:hypothetical protein